MSHNAEKTERGDPLVSPGIVSYAEKEEILFWFSSLGQMIQFRTKKFCRISKNYLGQFLCFENEIFTIIVAFRFMKRRPKTKSPPN